MKFRTGQWVRVTTWNSPALGWRGIVESSKEGVVYVTFPHRARVWEFNEGQLKLAPRVDE